MNYNELLKLIESHLTEAAAGMEHERLKKELTEWATSKGFDSEHKTLPSGAIPDVLRSQNKEYIFVGDAKDAKNEDAQKSETLKRIKGYIEEFKELLGSKAFKGGFIAIATNAREAALGWSTALNTLCTASGITSGAGTQPSFSILETNPGKTWVIYW